MSFRYIYCGAWNFKGEVKGIKCFGPDAAAGLAEERVYGEAFAGQSILAVAGDKLVSVCELGEGGIVVSYAIRPDGGLDELDALTFGSAKLSYVTAAPNGRYVFVSSMGDGTVKMIRVGADGKLDLTDEWKLTGHSVTPRQNQAKVHSVMISPDGSLLAAANLGADELELFEVDYGREVLRLTASVPVDAGREPRHLAFHPSGDYLYLLTESGNRLYVYQVCSGRLRELAAYGTLDPAAEPGGAAADVVVSPDGRFVYSSNRGQSNIAVWRVMDSGLLDSAGFFSCGGKSPRGLNLTPDGKELLCANNDSGTVTVLPLDADTGLPGPAVCSVKAPFAGCVRSI